MYWRTLFKILYSAVIPIAFISGTAFSQIPQAQVSDELKSMICHDHPRLFFNRDTFPAVRAMALGREVERFRDMQRHVDAIAADSLEVKDYGTTASEAAFVYLVIGEKQYMELAREMLRQSILYYQQQYLNQQTVNWYAYSRNCAWTAFDWIFNNLSREEQEHIKSARETYQKWVEKTSADDITPELFLLGILADYEQFEEMKSVIENALEKKPESRASIDLKNWLLN